MSVVIPDPVSIDVPSWLADMRFHHLGFNGLTFCGATGVHPDKICPPYHGEAICPRCGTPTCPRCAQISSLDKSVRRVA